LAAASAAAAPAATNARSMSAPSEEVTAEQVMSDLLENPPPLWAKLRGDDLSDFALHERPTAELLVAGIEQAGREGRIPAWRHKGRTRYFARDEQSDGSWLTCCPAHDDHNPSFVVSDAEGENGKPKLLVYCRSGCSQRELIEVLDELGLWRRLPGALDNLKAVVGTSAAKPAQKTTKKKSTAIVPVPADAPEAPGHHPQLGPIRVRYTYRNADGELVLHVCRFEPNPTWEANCAGAPKGEVEKPDHKTFRPLSFCKFEDGSTRWSWVAPETDIPLYRADKLAANPTAKVIVCEGEKAAQEAQRLFPDRVAITWLGGAKAVRKAPWIALARRDVLVWPDHDDAGSKAAQAVVNEVRLIGAASIAVVDVAALAAVDPRNPDGPKRQPPQKWDAANAVAEWWSDLARLAMEVDRASGRLEARVRIEASPDNIGETVDKAEEVLRNSHLPIFQRAGFIVRAGQYTEKFADRYIQLVLSAHELYSAGLGEVLERVIRFEQSDARRKGNGTKPVHAPELLLKTFLERGKLSGLNPLTGVTDIPLIRRNGTLLDVPDYDEATGIFYKPSGLALNIPAHPTRDDAIEAVETLTHLIRDFPFQSGVDKAAAVSAFISSVNRPMLGAIPLHAFSAPTPGSGKSLLATLVTIVATGNLPAFITQGPNEEELEKRISAQMLAGRQVINLDNCNRPLRGAALCNLLTAERVSLRVLGLSKMPEITSSSFILANGNNMRLADDMVRRTVMSHIDPKMERPEEREIDWDAGAEARRNRGKYVSACLTIMLAYRAAGAPKQTTPLGSFETWSRSVRDAIVWAGLPDPCANASKLREADPELERFLNVAQRWEQHFGTNWKKVADVIAVANNHETSELKLVLMNVADAGRVVNANRLAAFLSRYADRQLAGFKFGSRKGHAGAKLWRLETLP
jgi:putative DNA primase/helicase